MTNTSSQTTLATVAAMPTQAGENSRRKLVLSLGSSAVWTERMLDTLERGIKGGQWYSLIDHQRYPNAYFAELGLISLNALTRAKRANPA